MNYSIHKGYQKPLVQVHGGRGVSPPPSTRNTGKRIPPTLARRKAYRTAKAMAFFLTHQRAEVTEQISGLKSRKRRHGGERQGGGGSPAAEHGRERRWKARSRQRT